MSECDYHSWKSIKPGAHCPYCTINKLRDKRDININVIKDLEAKYDTLEKASLLMSSELLILDRHAEAMADRVEVYAEGGCIDGYYIEGCTNCLSQLVDNYRKDFPKEDECLKT